ncbi:response regulator transcription factor [Geitlerinema splendidum]|nr:response regulator transcription factor [Geitlerinema splendidum]
MANALIVLVERARGNSHSGRDSFSEALKKRYEVVSVPSGKQAVSAARLSTPDIIILDSISLHTPGERIARQIKDTLSPIPLIHLRAADDPKTESAAEVVLRMPFTSRKLINSIERLLKRSTEVGDHLLVAGPLSMDVGRRLLFAKGQETALTPKLAALVELFLRHPGEILDRKKLMEHVWQTDYLGDTRTLDVHIRWFRSAIEVDPGKPTLLKTVRGVGYRLEI